MSCSRIVVIHKVNTDPDSQFSAIKLEELSVKKLTPSLSSLSSLLFQDLASGYNLYVKPPD